MNHREIIELLPWYANETLAQDERAMIEAHLAECGDCAREVKNLASMRKAVVEAGNQVPSLSPMALNRALAEIENYEETKAQARAPQREQATNFWNRWWKPTPLFARALIAVQVVLVLALGTVTLYQHNHPNIVYTTASGNPMVDKGSATIVISFSETASEQDVRQTILAIKGKIVDGPSALGLYTVQIPIPRERTADVEHVLETLRQNQKVVRFAAQKQ